MMASAISPSLGTLDLLAVERICEYLDDDAEQRRDLWAFSMTNKYLYAATAKQRFIRVHLELSSLKDM
jgi:hypothetical protein